MVALVSAFRLCGRASASLGPVVILAQLVLLTAWAPTRLVFLALEGAAKRAYWADAQLRHRLAVAD